MNHQEIYEQICNPAFGRIESKIDKIVYHIEGNGTPGLKTRVDRLEQRAAFQSRLIWVLITALTGTIVADMYDRITQLPLPKDYNKHMTIAYYPTE